MQNVLRSDAGFGVEWGPKSGNLRNKAVLALILVLATLLAPLRSAAGADTGPKMDVIVRALPGATAAVADAVEAVGGDVTRRLEAVGAVTAEVPRAAVARLERMVGLGRVTPDSSLKLLNSTYDAGSELGSLHNTAKLAGAEADASKGFTGKGVDVALIDSGVTPVEGLTTSGKVVNGPDLSFDSQDPNVRHLDAFGHGTNMAGIIAGKDNNVTTAADTEDPAKFTGVAPDARIVSVKVAAADGSTDVSQVLAGIDWVVQHRRSNGLNIRVLNLSFGTNSTQSYLLDPLAYAAEVAWHKGIVVVVAAGNNGLGGQVTNPAIDPYVLAVGASDHMGTKTRDDDKVASFSSRRDDGRKADVLAPGKSVASLRDPGSFIDRTYPGGVVGGRFFKGSGTSQAAAVTSGAVAVLLQARPELTPDTVKGLIVKTAAPVSDPTAYGAGLLRVNRAINSNTTIAPQNWPKATGVGSLEQARGGTHVSMGGVELNDERDIFGNAWNGTSWTGTSWTGTSWTGGNWNGTSWTGDGWTGTSWTGTSWTGTSWTGTSWTGTSWTGTSWTGTSWTGTSWTGTSWTGTSWTGTSWTGTSWTGTSWTGTSWTSAIWGE